MVHRSRLRRPVAGLASVPFAAAFDCCCIRRPEASAIDDCLKRPVRDMQHMLRLHIQAGHVDTACKTIDANDRVLPAGAARRHAAPMALRVVAFANDSGRTPAAGMHRRNAPRCRASHAIPSTCSSTSPPDLPKPEPTEFPCVRAAIACFRTDSALPTRQIQRPFVRLTILYSPLATLREPALAESRRSGPGCRNAIPDMWTRPPTGNAPPRGTGRMAGDPHRTDLLSAPYPGIVVAATIRIAPRPASTPNVELVTP